MKHLRNKQYYIDLYDRHTVEECRSMEQRVLAKEKTRPKTTNSKKEEMKQEVTKMASRVSFYFVKGERYANKSEVISKWMKRDEELDKFFDAAEAPKRIHCLTCGSLMTPIHKNLHSHGLNEKDRVLFMYDCPNKCKPMRAFFDNGEEWVPKPNLCPKCGRKLKSSDKKLNDKLISTEICSQCGYKDTYKFNLSAKKKKETKLDKNFAKDRERFCMSEEEGQEYISEKYRLESVTKMIEDSNKKKELKKKTKQIKKLNIAGLSKFLSKPLKEQGYIGLAFSKPKIDRDLIVSFTIQDNELRRKEYDSKNILRKIIITALKDTNWHLMTGGVNYKLGILSGRLRGQDRDEIEI